MINEDTPEGIVKSIHFCKMSMSLGEGLLSESTSWDEEHTHQQDIQEDKREIARLEKLLKVKIAELSLEDQQKFMAWFESYVKDSVKPVTKQTEDSSAN